MSAPEYDQKAEDHRAILILLRILNCSETENIDNVQNCNDFAFWNNLLEKIEQNDEIRINESGLGYERVVRLRLKRQTYPHVNHEWGDFQAHRRLYGVFSFGLTNEQQDSNSLFDKHIKLTDSYPGLVDSRCFLINQRSSSQDADQIDNLSLFTRSSVNNHLVEPNNNAKDNEVAIVQRNNVSIDSVNVTSKETINQLSNEFNANVNITNNLISNGNSNRTSQCLQFEYDFNHLNDIVDHVVEAVRREMQSLIASIFYVLESKRLDKSYEKQDRVPLLLAPFESKSLVGVDQDAKVLKRKSLARMRKNMGDLCLLIGSPAEALSNYATAIEQLRSNQDLLWLSAALEGQCIASLALINSNSNSPANTVNSSVSPPPDPPPDTDANEIGTEVLTKSAGKRTPLQRIFSIPAHRVRPLSSDSTPPSSSSINSVATNNANVANNGLLDGKSTYIRSARSNLTKRFAQTIQAGQARSLPASLDPMLVKLLGKNLLSTPDELFERYREACCHYAKFKLAAVIELECSLKAARVLTNLGRFLLASDFLQNSVFIVCGRNLDEQIKKLEVVAELYENIGFKRKCAFYRRFSALKTISNGLDKESWERCYQLLVPALPGYRLTLDSTHYTRLLRNKQAGWISIHIQLLQELATMSRRMGCEALTQRHVAFLLQCLFEYLTVSQRVELACQLISLQTRTANCADSSLADYKQYLHPTNVQMYKIPLLTKIEPVCPPAHLRPHQLACLKKNTKSQLHLSNSPFIFTPMQLHRPNLNRRRSQPYVQDTDFCWVAGEPCHVNLHFINPLPCELEINQMALLSEPQTHFKSDIISRTLSNDTNPNILQISGIPQNSGKLELTGYSVQVFGLNSECKLEDIPTLKKNRFPSKYCIEIVPPLPLLNVSLLSVIKANSNGSDDQMSIIDHFDYKLDSFQNKSSMFIQLYSGESRTVRLQLTNCSKDGQLIQLISGTIITSLSAPIRNQVLHFDCEQLNQHLPLDQNQSIQFDLPLFAHAQFNLANSKLHHNTNNSVVQTLNSHHQQSHYHSQNNISHNHLSTSTSNINMNTNVVGNATNSRPDSPQLVPSAKKQLNSIGSTLANFLNELQSTPKMMHKFTQEASPVRDAPQTVSQSCQEYNITLELEYSGSSGLIDGYGRKHLIKFDMKILPSLVITRWDVLPAETPDHCYLVFDVLNATEYEMELEYSAQKSIIIEAGETCRIPVPVLRCMLPQNGSNADLNQICRQHLKKQVRLLWTLLNGSINDRVSGVASIEEIEWNKQALDCILMASLSWNVQVNDLVLSQNDEIKVRVGEIVNVRVEFRNCCGQAIHYLNLMLDCFQDQLNGKRRYNLTGKKTIIGKDRIHIHQLQCQENYVHECKYVFFYPGLYKLDIHCNGNEIRQSNSSESEIGHNPNVVSTTCTMIGTSNCSTTSVQQQSANEKTVDWVFSPLVEILVLE